MLRSCGPKPKTLNQIGALGLERRRLQEGFSDLKGVRFRLLGASWKFPKTRGTFLGVPILRTPDLGSILGCRCYENYLISSLVCFYDGSLAPWSHHKAHTYWHHNDG